MRPNMGLVFMLANLIKMGYDVDNSGSGTFYFSKDLRVLGTAMSFEEAVCGAFAHMAIDKIRRTSMTM